MEEERLETENRRLADQLSNQVSHLKSLAYDIELETKEHNRLLGGLGWDFDGSQGILSGSMGRVNKMLKSNRSNRRLMCYVILGVVVLVLLGYALASRATHQ
ncbi:BET1-like protein [Dermacentor silvarum]|uniref:BET1-like protein n=1 Tax=Dermacentor silvarum TaxID=543639 RepID=UPI0018979A37|nr:BET1-like protein [Dermacentor silvarum]XP_049514880.1 BET1-like protein [Dermacentor silvarum]